jgi:hypothetical protein
VPQPLRVFAGEDGADGLQVDGAPGGDSECCGKVGFGCAGGGMACARSAARWCAGFLPGDSALDRIAAVTDPALHKPDTMAALASGLERACPGGVASARASDQRAAEGLAAGW